MSPSAVSASSISGAMAPLNCFLSLSFTRKGDRSIGHEWTVVAKAIASSKKKTNKK